MLIWDTTNKTLFSTRNRDARPTMRLPSDSLMERFAAEGLIAPKSATTLHRLAFVIWICLCGAFVCALLFAVLLVTRNADSTPLYASAAGMLGLDLVAFVLAIIWTLVLYAGYGKKT